MKKTIVAPVVLGLSTLVQASPLVRRQANETPSYNYINYTQYSGTPGPVEVQILLNGGTRNETAPYLYGWMHEDISHSGDGGLYGELLVNRAFQGSGATIGSLPGVPGSSIVSAENPILPFGPVTTGWKVIGDAYITLTVLHPLSAALPVALQLDIPVDATGEVGILNEGYWGIDVRPQTYNASVYIKSNGPRNNGTLSAVNMSLRSNLTGETWAQTSIPTANISDFRYQHFETRIPNQALPGHSNNTFAITFDAAEVAGNTYYFALASLFGETYKDTKIRRDLGQAIEDLGATFLRFPGGNNLEGYSIDQRWKWNETVGPLADRPGRVGDWGYGNTNGLGLMEYLDFCEAARLQPLLGVYAGFSLDIYGQAGVSFPEDQMHLVLDDILAELEFITGDADTFWGGRRAAYGHPAPYALEYVEIGNEDWFSATYPYRFPYLYAGIKQAYPSLNIISSAYDENAAYNISLPANSLWDTHHYEPPSFFLENFDFFDNWAARTGQQPNVSVFIGESSTFQYDTPSGAVNFSNPVGLHIFRPNLMAAVAEAVYLLGAERNPRTVTFSAYAPSLANRDWPNWTPNLLEFDADHDRTVPSASYAVQRLFARHRGRETVPVTTVEGNFNPLWWAASVDDDDDIDGTLFFKVVNSGNSSVPLTLGLDEGALSASGFAVNGSAIQAPSLMAFNSVDDPDAVVARDIVDLPRETAAGPAWVWDVPAFSVNVLQFTPRR